MTGGWAHPEMEPPWVDPLQCKLVISPKQAQLVKGAVLNPQGGLKLHPRSSIPLASGGCKFSSTLEAAPPLPSSRRGGHRPQATSQLFCSLSI